MHSRAASSAPPLQMARGGGTKGAMQGHPDYAHDFIAIVGILVAAATALWVAYLHRKQMRQIEAFRSNPALGLVPPPNQIWVFIKSNILLLCAAVALLFLLLDVFSSAPVTRRVVFNIAWDAVSFVIFVLLHISLKFVRLFGKVISAITRLIDGQIHTSEFVLEQIEINKNMVEALKPKDDQPPIKEMSAGGAKL
jgi:hypothetical protein